MLVGTRAYVDYQGITVKTDVVVDLIGDVVVTVLEQLVVYNEGRFSHLL